jgi:hypothetical protein
LKRVMSLTGHLEDPSSSVRQWFADRLPDTGVVARDANHVLRGPPNQRDGRIVTLGRAKEPPLPCRAADHALCGSALDLLARAVLRSGALEWSAAGDGAGRIVVGPGIPPAMGIEREVVARIEVLRPWEPAFPDDGWRELAELCLLLARFEQARRSREAVQFAVERVREAPPTLAGYAGALVDPDAVEDVATAAPAVAADHADLREVDRLEFGPAFGLSRGLGGADADVIAGDLLLDFKATSTTRIAGRSELWQLAGYALADLGDKFGVRWVGISALRWRRRWTIPLVELLERLAGQSVNLEEARCEFASVVEVRSQAPRRRGHPPA